VGSRISGDCWLPEAYPGGYITANAFDIIGIKPILGRGLVAADDEPDAPPVVLISSGIWKSRYGADPGVIGQQVNNNSVPMTVIGVTPNGFKWPFQHPSRRAENLPQAFEEPL
jgi:putative ABC transport system permease protein